MTQMLGRTRASVVAMTGGKQIPWVNSSLAVEFYLKPAVTDAPAVDERTVEVAYWESVERSGSEEALQNYLIRYPKGAFVELARAKLEARRIESDRSKVRARRIGELESWIRANRKEFNARLNEFWSPRKSQPGWGRTRVVSHDVVGMKGDYFVLRARLEEISFGNMSTETFLVDLDDGGIRFLGMHRPRS